MYQDAKFLVCIFDVPAAKGFYYQDPKRYVSEMKECGQ